MDNNEAREMDYADNMTGPDHEQFEFDRNHSHCMDRTGINYTPCSTLTHCPSICDCPVGACTAAELNPNRPTPQGYCAQGNHPSSYHYNDDDACYSQPQPLTAYNQGIRDRAATVDALTPAQMKTALLYLSGANDSWETGKADPRWANAIAYALNPR